MMLLSRWQRGTRQKTRISFNLGRPFLHDPGHDMALECAVASGRRYIVTHKVKDFRRVPELKVKALKPADFLTLLMN